MFEQFEREQKLPHPYCALYEALNAHSHETPEEESLLLDEAIRLAILQAPEAIHWRSIQTGGLKPIHWAAAHDRVELLRFLTAQGSSLGPTSDHEQLTVTGVACKSSRGPALLHLLSDYPLGIHSQIHAFMLEGLLLLLGFALAFVILMA